ncbi:hypothetical protein LPB41_30815 [Thalassospira sp. MA62]|nr:hypothetical protein [Thalassospira sp. MA62]
MLFSVLARRNHKKKPPHCKDRGNRITAIGFADFFKVVGHFCTGIGLASGEFLFFGQGVAHMDHVTGNPGKEHTIYPVWQDTGQLFGKFKRNRGCAFGNAGNSQGC